MYKQIEYLRDGDTMALGETYHLDLPKSGMLSALQVQVSGACVSGATLGGGDYRLIDFLPTIEVIANGATVIKSLSAKHLYYINWLKQGVLPVHNWRNYATNTQFDNFFILFGRRLFDQQYGLDLGRYDQCELKITNNASATYYGAALGVTILQHWWRDFAGGFQGFLRSELWRQWTTVQNETKYLLLPSEYPISGLYLRALPSVTNGLSDTGFANLMYDIDFSMGGGTKRLYKGGLSQLALANYQEKGLLALTAAELDLTADKGVDVGLGRLFGWSGISGSKDGAVSAVVPTELADAADNTISFEAREADSPIEVINMGYAPMNMSYLIDVPDLDPNLMLDPKRDGETRLNIQTRNAAASADGTNEVVLERVVA
jgi:hypothetical protein